MGKNRKDLPNKQRYPPAVTDTVYKRFDYIGLQAVFSGIRIAYTSLRSCPNLGIFQGEADVKSIASLFVLSLLIGSGCGGGGTTAGGYQQPSSLTNPPQPSPETIIKAPAAQQLIIKFKPNTIACTPEGIAQFSSTTHVSLEFVRTMSGDACVVKQFADSVDDLLHGQKTLKENPAVEYLEPDAIMEAL
jgi:hypothetical protein